MFFISPSLHSNAHYPLVNGGLGAGGSHGFSELYRRWDSRRYPQLINGVDVNRMTPEQIYDYFVRTHFIIMPNFRLISNSNSMRSHSRTMWSRPYPTLKYTGKTTRRWKRRRSRAARRTASVSCATAIMRTVKQ